MTTADAPGRTDRAAAAGARRARLEARHGGVLGLRLTAMAAVGGLALAPPSWLPEADRERVLMVCVFGALAQLLAWLEPRRQPSHLTAAVWASLVVDAAWAGAVVAATGGPGGPFAGLLVLAALWATIGYSAALGLVAGLAASATGLVLLVAEGGDPGGATAVGGLAFLWAVLVSAAVGAAASERELRARAQRLEVLHRAARRLVGEDDPEAMVEITRRAAQRVMPGWSVHMRAGSAPSTVVVRTSGLDSAVVVPVGSEAQGFGVIECRRPLFARVVHHGVRSRDIGPLETLAASLAGALARARLMASVERRSLTDELTGLGNRRSFDIELARRTAESQRTGRPVSLCLVDIDHFKAYNDAFGHLAGDVALAAVAQAVRASSRLTDIAARYGGEELALILPGTEHENALEVAERVRAAVAAVDTGHRGLSVSIGVATGDGECSAEVLVEAADRAMYAAKAAGRDRVVGGSTRLSPLDPESAAGS